MNDNRQGPLAEGWPTPPSGPVMAPSYALAHSQPLFHSKGEAVLTNGMTYTMETTNQSTRDVNTTPESDAEDEEVRNLDLPAQVGIDLRSKAGLDRLCPDATVNERDRERPMSWEGELSDQEIQQDAPRLKSEPSASADEETAMEGVQSVGPSSPQPMYAAPEVPPSAISVKSERLWHSALPVPLKSQQEALEQQRIRRSPPLALTQRPGFETLTGHTPAASPLTGRHPIRLPLSASGLPHPPTPSPDSAIHSAYYSPTASPGQSRHRNGSGLSSPYSHRASPSLSRNNSDASQYSQFGGSQYSYSSAPSPLSPSPAQSPVQPRHMAMLAATGGYPSPVLTRPGHGLGALGEFPPSPLLFRPGHIPQFPVATPAGSLPGVRDLEIKTEAAGGLSAPSIDSIEESTRDVMDDKGLNPADLAQHTALAAQAGISRQQLINSPCPICGDKISGFHYGIFSCESCKGFFKRTVQNKKNYVCLRGATCPVTIATRKKCPACRFEKCLNTGMKLEAIREDRTRGGRSTYQCTYALPAGVLASGPEGSKPSGSLMNHEGSSSRSMDSDWSTPSSSQDERAVAVPQLLLEIMNVEHFWHCTEQEQQQHHRRHQHFSSSSFSGQNGAPAEDFSSLCSIADHRLYKIVKWCKSLPLFKSIHIDDQISLLINTWCELLLLACCYRSMSTPGEIRISLGKSINVDQSRALGLGPCIERMVNFTDHLRRLRVDQYEYAALKVIILLSSDTSGLKEPESVRASQESVLQALQQYTLSHYPDIPSKFGELLLRIPELERTCQVAKEMLTMKREGDGQGFNLLMELLRGDH